MVYINKHTIVYILGITHPVSRNSAACLLKDGRILSFVEEERFNKIKHSPDLPPKKSIEYCLKEAKIRLDEVDYIAVGYDRFIKIISSDVINKISGLFGRVSTSAALVADDINLGKKPSVLSTTFEYTINYLKGFYKLPFDINDQRVMFIRHHLAHLASAFYVSPFDEACIISADGGGGQEAGMLALGQGNRIKVIERIPAAHSLGYLYSTFTQLLGFRPHDGEGKVMGLSAYGSKNARVLPFVTFERGIARINGHEMNQFIMKIKPKLKEDPLHTVNRNLAASLQKTIEEAYVYMAKFLYEKTRVRNYCLTGGVSLNCLANTKVLRLNFVDEVFVQPVSTDAGTALGAALQVYLNTKNKRPGYEMKHVYYGPKFDNKEILCFIKKAELPYYKKVGSIERTAATLLSEGKIVGWFQGKMEVGPRALGNRSILANPALPGTKDIINNKVKGREYWRPFAPSILEEFAPDYLLDVSRSPFMILESKVREDRLSDIVSAAHVDGTVRPQTVSKKTNVKYWKLIDEFRKITDIPVLLNTSFNIAGEPIVCTPGDAISTFFRCGMDCLIMGNYLISKTSNLLI